jgi:predicted YcjX-like family ATPase
MKTLAIAAVKSTTSGKTLYKGQKVPVIQGNTLPIGQESPRKITLFPGAVPEVLPEKNYWQECAFNFINFLPITGMAKHEPLPHIRMDQVLQFLLADKMI